VAMPHFNGIEALKNMRANCPDLKFILITGLGNQDLLEDCEKLDCQILRKPLEKELFLETVYELLGNELESMSKAS
ncbi:hypothetical protein ACFLRA_03700, partial [Bdellovibrionota bacterium]